MPPGWLRFARHDDVKKDREPMTRLRSFLLVALTGLACASSSVACANDSIGETALGGLTLVKNDAISMDSEDLYISRDRVEVKYRFTNRSDAAVEALVAFPLPVLPPGNEAGEEEAVYWGDAQGDLQFETRVDGQPLPLQLVEQAFFSRQGCERAAFRARRSAQSLLKTLQRGRERLAQGGTRQARCG